ncbi:MAG: dTDP-4-dehydrorhamnose reductase [Burkholderiales bacterium]
MRIMLFGRGGQVGWELERALGVLGPLIAFDRDQVDLRDAAALAHAIRSNPPDVIVNAAAYTAVDAAETATDDANALNALAPKVMAEEALRSNALLIHYSTDYVFDGASAAPYREDASTNPVNVYGRTKLAGEEAIIGSGARHVILRTSWVFGAHGQNFVRTMRKLAAERSELRVVADQFGAPTYARHLAAATLAILARAGATNGVFHATAADSTSWFEFAQAIVRASALSTSIVPITTAEFPRPAKRPSNSRLDCARLKRTYGIELPSWQSGLAQCLAEMGD